MIIPFAHGKLDVEEYLSTDVSWKSICGRCSPPKPVELTSDTEVGGIAVRSAARPWCSGSSSCSELIQLPVLEL